jgi:hypothetical protein
MKCRSTDLIEGKRCKAFCYSGKVVLSIKDYMDKQEKAELKELRLKRETIFGLWTAIRKETSTLTTRLQ